MAVLAALVLMAYAAVYPPFLRPPTEDDTKLFRLFFEASIVTFLALSIWKTAADRYVAILAIFCLYVINWQTSGELMQNALSYFVKLGFLVFLSTALQKNSALAAALRNVWVKFWVYCAITGMMGYVFLVTRIVPPQILDYAYLYYHYPLIGNFLLKDTTPRYTGFLAEPIEAGLIFGFNMVAARALIPSVRRRKWFVRLNLVGGLMTASYVFFIYLAVLVALRSKTVARLVANKFSLTVLIVLVVASISTLLTWLLSVGGVLLPYSSIGVRIGQYVRAISFLQGATPSQWLFGAGIEPFHRAIGGGASAGVLDVLASRGLILAGVWLYLIHDRAKHVKGLFAYILLYSLVLDFWHFPIFIIGLSVVAAAPALTAPAMISSNPRPGRRDAVAATIIPPLPAQHSP